MSGVTLEPRFQWGDRRAAPPWRFDQRRTTYSIRFGKGMSSTSEPPAERRAKPPIAGLPGNWGSTPLVVISDGSTRTN